MTKIKSPLVKTENTSVVVPDERIMDKIYLIRGQKVMLDMDLAELFSEYGVLHELVFTYLDELISKQEDQSTRKRIGYKIND